MGKGAAGSGAACTAAACTGLGAACDGNGASTPMAESARFKAATHARIVPVVMFNGIPSATVLNSTQSLAH